MKHHKILSALLAASMLGSSTAVTVSALSPHGTGLSIRDGWLINDPSYSFSAAYKATVWYENFTALELSGNARNDVLAIALSQLGYHGGPTGDYSGTYNGSSTSDAYKCTEYGRLLVNKYGNNFNENAFDWCACFVNWCLSQAHVDYASGELGCWRWVEELKEINLFQSSSAYRGTYTPRPADIIFFNWDENNNYSSHVGLVLYVTSGRVYTVEGNSGNQVKVRSYALSDPAIIGYGTPRYDEGDIPTVDHSYKNGMPIGEYVVSIAGQTLKTTPGGSVAVSSIGAIPVGGRVTLVAVSGDYALVRYSGKRGYIPRSLLCLLEREEAVLTYDAGNGSNPPAPTTAFVGDSVPVSESIPSREGYMFLGWSRFPLSETVDFLAGDTLTVTEHITLYAVWEEIPSPPDETLTETAESDTESESESDTDTDADTEADESQSCESAERESLDETESDRATETADETSRGENDSSAVLAETGCAAATSLASLSFLLASGVALLRRRKKYE